MVQVTKIFSYIGLLIFLYYISYYFYVGILNPIPALGDSWDYHIPISKSILDGSFINPAHFTTKTYFAKLNPGSSEVFDAILLLLRIPLTISNILATVVLTICCFFLARSFKLEYFYSFLFATTIGTLTAITRWLNSVSIDVWLAVFFILSIILLEKPKKTYLYFLKLGIVFGMLVGSKYSAWGLIFILLILYGKKIWQVLTIKSFIVFVIPFFIFGVFWYIRNYLSVGNPLWPFCILSLPCKAIYYNSHVNMLDAIINRPIETLNSLFSEYKLWGLSLLSIIPILYLKLRQNISPPKKALLLYFLGITNLVFFLKFPTSYQPWIIVSSFRYSYPIFIPLILCVFILCSAYKKEVYLGYFAVANMLCTLTFAFYPKLILLYLPLFILVVLIIEKGYKKFGINKIVQSNVKKK